MRALWYPPATRVPFHDRRPDAKKWRHGSEPYWGVVNHVAQSETMRWFVRESTSASAHFSIDADGRVYQGVPLDYCAWHAGWGAGRKYAPTWPRADDVPRATTHMRLRSPNPNLVLIGIEHAGFTAPPKFMLARKPPARRSYDRAVASIYGPTRPWPEPMVAASIALHQWLWRERWIEDAPSYTTVIGHNQLDSVSRADDPGAEWYARVQPRLLEALQPAAPDPPPTPPADVDTELRRVSSELRAVGSLLNGISDRLGGNG